MLRNLTQPFHTRSDTRQYNEPDSFDPQLFKAINAAQSFHSARRAAIIINVQVSP